MSNKRSFGEALKDCVGSCSALEPGRRFVSVMGVKPVCESENRRMLSLTPRFSEVFDPNCSQEPLQRFPRKNALLENR